VMFAYLTINIDPVIGHLGPLTFRWYGVIMSLAVIVGGWVFMREAGKRGIGRDHAPVGVCCSPASAPMRCGGDGCFPETTDEQRLAFGGSLGGGASATLTQCSWIGCDTVSAVMSLPSRVQAARPRAARLRLRTTGTPRAAHRASVAHRQS
jgi:hypothetical protein